MYTQSHVGLGCGQIPPRVGSAVGVGRPRARPAGAAGGRADPRHRLRHGAVDAEAIRRRAGDARVAAIDRSWTMLTEARGSVPASGRPGRRGRAAVRRRLRRRVQHGDVPLDADHRRCLPRSTGCSAAADVWSRRPAAGPTSRRLRAGGGAVASEPEYRASFHGWRDPWTFAGVDETRERLSAAGFTGIHVWLESTPTSFPDAVQYSEFVTTVCLRHHLARLPGREPRPLRRSLIAVARKTTRR